MIERDINEYLGEHPLTISPFMKELPSNARLLGVVRTKEKSFLTPFGKTANGENEYLAYLVHSEIKKYYRHRWGDDFERSTPRSNVYVNPLSSTDIEIDISRAGKWVVVLKGHDSGMSDFKRFDSEQEALDAFEKTFGDMP